MPGGSFWGGAGQFGSRSAFGSGAVGQFASGIAPVAPGTEDGRDEDARDAVLRAELARLLDVGDGGPDADDALDVLWIARLGGLDPVDPLLLANDRTGTASSAQDRTPAPRPEHPAPDAGPEPPQAGLHLPAGADTATPPRSGGAHAMRVARPRALPDTLALTRALRPLRQTVPSARFRTLDVTATAAASADTGLLLPVVRPARELRFSVDLLIDTGTTMSVWHGLADELRTLAARHGAFADVRAWALHTEGPEPALAPFRRGARAAAPTRRWRQALADPTGRRAVLVLTDGVGESWYGDELPAALADWSRTRPVAALQVLPSRLWHRTALRASLVRARRTPAADGRIEVRSSGPLPGIDRSPAGAADRALIHWLPVLEVSGDWLTPWARLVSGATNDWTPLQAAPLTVVDRPVRAARAAEPADPAGWIERFEEGYSPDAFRLLRLLAAAPLSLPVMRLVQRTMLPASTPMHLAEIFLSGLLVRRTPPVPGEDPESVLYDFRDGVRDALLDRLTRTESLRVLRQVMDEVSERVAATLAGVSDFAAWVAALGGREGLSGLQLPEESRAFAEVTVAVIRGVGGDYAEVAGRLTRDWAAARAPETPAEPREPEQQPGAAARGRMSLPSLLRRRGRGRGAEPDADIADRREPDHRGGAGSAQVPHGIPPLPSGYVRRAEAGDVMAALDMSRFTEHSTCVIEGPRGVGKTALAIDCARRAADGSTMVRWIDAHRRETLLAGLVRLVQDLGLPVEAENGFPALHLRELGAYLRSRPGWLLVYDGVTEDTFTPSPGEPPTPAALCLPPMGYGRLLMTHAEGVRLPFTRRTRVTLADFTLTEAVSYLQTALGDRRGELWLRRTELADLVQVTGANPLALSRVVSSLTRSRVPVARHVQEELASRPAVDRSLRSLVWITEGEDFVGTGIAVRPDVVLTTQLGASHGELEVHQLGRGSVRVAHTTEPKGVPGVTVAQLRDSALQAVRAAPADRGAVAAAWYVRPVPGASMPTVRLSPAESEEHLLPPGAAVLDAQGRLCAMVVRTQKGTARVHVPRLLIENTLTLAVGRVGQVRERAREIELPETASREPLFFLSYARPESDAGEPAGSPEVRFFNELCAYVRELTRHRGEDVGFIDRDITMGEDWREQVNEAMVRAKVFVPLYSPQYFASAFAGSGWDIFWARRRSDDGPSSGMPAVVPVLWTPTSRDQRPLSAMLAEFPYEELVSGYAEHGLRGLMESGPEDAYRRAVRRIAHQIVAATRDSPGGDRDPHGRAK
ncbi:TIR-like protein FxsC [Streptomyces hokutonensis]|uniref:TIR-like protein FxsC n=1 Tax=Streptomyces hokutonensis TaxID=1306990 RepID=UPI0003A18677|nr:TIR-like protein FxsC [Streptomyces hokutonensis]